MNSVHVCGVCVCVCPTWWIGFLFTCLWNKATAKFQPLLDILLISHRPILSMVHVCMCVCELTHIAAVVQCRCMVVVNDRFLLCSLQCSVCVLYVCVFLFLALFEQDASFQQHPSRCPSNVNIRWNTLGPFSLNDHCGVWYLHAPAQHADINVDSADCGGQAIIFPEYPSNHLSATANNYQLHASND